MKRAVIASALLSLMASIASGQQSQDVQSQSRGVTSSYDPAFSRVTQIYGIATTSGQFVSNLPDLKQQALVGNAQASAKLAAELSMCNGAMQRPTESFYQEHCVGVTASDLSERGKWLSLAASQGDVEAQYGYAEGGPRDIVGVQDGGQEPVTLSVYKDTARKYLLELSQKCNIGAISLMALDGRRNGMFFGDNPIVSYKFLSVYKTIARKPMADAVDADEKALETKISSSYALSNAQQDAASFVTSYCK